MNKESLPTKYVSLRLPEDMHAALTALAQRDRRSLHAEIVYILERFLDAEGKAAARSERAAA